VGGRPCLRFYGLAYRREEGKATVNLAPYVDEWLGVHGILTRLISIQDTHDFTNRDPDFQNYICFRVRVQNDNIRCNIQLLHKNSVAADRTPPPGAGGGRPDIHQSRRQPPWKGELTYV